MKTIDREIFILPLQRSDHTSEQIEKTYLDDSSTAQQRSFDAYSPQRKH